MTRSLKSLLAVASLAFILLYLAVALARFGYPYDLEWLEGQAAATAARIAAGERVYVEPTLDHVPEVYTPLYFYLAALASPLLGLGLTPLRLMSMLFSLGSLALLFRWAARECGSRLHGLLAAGLFAATFPLSGYWFDLARVDSTFLFFLLLALYLARFGASRGSGLAAGLAFSAALLTKQTGALLLVPLVVWFLAAGRRRGLAFLGSAAAATGGGLLALHLLHGRWFFYYTLLLPARDALRPEMILRFWWSDLLLPLPVACGLAAWYLTGGPRRQNAGPLGRAEEAWREDDESRRQSAGPQPRAGEPQRPADGLRRRAEEPRRPQVAPGAGEDRTRLFYLLAGGGMLALAWLGRIHRGGYSNVLQPAHAFLSLLFALGLAKAEAAWEAARRRSDGERPEEAPGDSAARGLEERDSRPQAAEGAEAWRWQPAEATPSPSEDALDGASTHLISEARPEPASIEAEKEVAGLPRHGLPALVLPAICLAALLQLLLLAYDPRTHVPTRADREAGAALVARLAAVDGPLLVPDHCHLPVLAGKEICAGRGAMMPILAGPEDEVRRTFVEQGRQAIRERRYGAILLDRDRLGPFTTEIESGYRKDPAGLYSSDEVFWTRSGQRTRPEALYLPRADPLAGS